MMVALALASYLLPVLAHVSARFPAISPATSFLVFFNLSYGPHALSTEWMRMTSLYPQEVHDAYTWGIIISNTAIAMGFLLGRRIGLQPLIDKRFAQTSAHNRLIPTNLLLAFALAYSTAFVLLDGPAAPRLIEITRYYLNTSIFSYEEIRREIFDGSLIETVMNYTRQSSSAITITLCVLASVIVRFPRKYLFLVAAAVVFYTASIQLNKFPILYILVACSISIIVYRTRSVSLSFGKFAKLLLTAASVLGILQLLYFVQYRDALSDGVVSAQALYNVIFYRMALTQADALRMWFAEFPTWTPHIGLANVNMLAILSSSNYVDVTSMIPQIYVGHYGTTFQTGFIGSGYASFGYLGVGLYGVLVSYLAVQLGNFSLLIRNFPLRCAYLGVVCMNVYFFNSRELSVALLSGGIVLAPAVAWILDRLVCQFGRTATRHSRS